MSHRVGWALVGFLVAACGAPSAPRAHHPEPRVVRDPGRDALAFALFGSRPTRAQLRVEHWGRHVALVADDQIYGSNGDDLPTMITGGLLGALAAPGTEPPERCAVVGLGTGVEAMALAALGCGRVDVYERDPAAFQNRLDLGEWSDPRLRFEGSEPPYRVRTEPPAGDERYSVIVQTTAATVLERPYRLFTVERFGRLAGLLTDDGVLVQHVQLYELHAEVHRRMMRTLAEAFEHLFVTGADNRSSDTLVIASRAPITVDVARIERWRARAEMARYVDAAHLDSPFAPVARAVFSSRADVVGYTGTSRPYTHADPMDPARMPLRPATLTADASPEAAAAWDEAYEAYDAQFATDLTMFVHSSEWDAGACVRDLQSCPVIRRRTGAAPIAYADWALAIVAEGRFLPARAALGRLQRSGVDVSRAAEILSLILSREGPASTFDPLRPFPSTEALDRATLDRTKAAWLARASDPLAAMQLLEPLAEALQQPPAVRVALVMVALQAADDLDSEFQRRGRALLEEETGWLDAHPAAWFYLAQLAFEAGEYPDAVRAMARYVELRPATP